MRSLRSTRYPSVCCPPRYIARRRSNIYLMLALPRKFPTAAIFIIYQPTALSLHVAATKWETPRLPTGSEQNKHYAPREYRFEKEFRRRHFCYNLPLLHAPSGHGPVSCERCHGKELIDRDQVYLRSGRSSLVGVGRQFSPGDDEGQSILSGSYLASPPDEDHFFLSYANPTEIFNGRSLAHRGHVCTRRGKQQYCQLKPR